MLKMVIGERGTTRVPDELDVWYQLWMSCCLRQVNQYLLKSLVMEFSISIT